MQCDAMRFKPKQLLALLAAFWMVLLFATVQYVSPRLNMNSGPVRANATTFTPMFLNAKKAELSQTEIMDSNKTKITLNTALNKVAMLLVLTSDMLSGITPSLPRLIEMWRYNSDLFDVFVILDADAPVLPELDGHFNVFPLRRFGEDGKPLQQHVEGVLRDLGVRFPPSFSFMLNSVSVEVLRVLYGKIFVHEVSGYSHWGWVEPLTYVSTLSEPLNSASWSNFDVVSFTGANKNLLSVQGLTIVSNSATMKSALEELMDEPSILIALMNSLRDFFVDEFAGAMRDARKAFSVLLFEEGPFSSDARASVSVYGDGFAAIEVRPSCENCQFKTQVDTLCRPLVGGGDRTAHQLEDVEKRPEFSVAWLQDGQWWHRPLERACFIDQTKSSDRFVFNRLTLQTKENFEVDYKSTFAPVLPTLGKLVIVYCKTDALAFVWWRNYFEVTLFHIDDAPPLKYLPPRTLFIIDQCQQNAWYSETLRLKTASPQVDVPYKGEWRENIFFPATGKMASLQLNRPLLMDVSGEVFWEDAYEPCVDVDVMIYRSKEKPRTGCAILYFVQAFEISYRFPAAVHYSPLRDLQSNIVKPSEFARSKTDFLAFIQGSVFKHKFYETDALIRWAIYQLLSQYKQGDYLGMLEWVRQSNNRVKDKCEGTQHDQMACLRPYKFVVCGENTISKGYISEKVLNAALAGVAVYVGPPDVTQLLNPNRIVLCEVSQSKINHMRSFFRGKPRKQRKFTIFPDGHQPSDQELLVWGNAELKDELGPCIKRVMELDRDDAAYERMLQQPLFHDNLAHTARASAEGVAELFRLLTPA